jgi:eukaryotic-like serine/threonine-protein kinase
MASAERLINLFNEAKARPTGAERLRLVAEACTDDAELKQQVLSLLRAHDQAANFLQATPFLTSTVLITEKPGDRIGRYKLLQHIGEGGCGVVYMAEQEEPVRRQVALKIIKLGMDTKSVIARFEAERQALALMDHPNIAKVLDAGATDAGRPYFVMELVRGLRITDYCDQNNLSTEQRLKLFTQVCQAVQHAHQKGIIHRDIKPSNFFVTHRPDGSSLLKILDFGISKANDGISELTGTQTVIGTPTYMAPEQARGGPATSKTDVYGLGIVAYQALAGRAPFTADSPVEILVQHLSSPVPPLARRCPDAPIGLCELVERMLAKRGDDRPTAAEVRHTLRELRAASEKRATAPQQAVPEPIFAYNDTPATIVVKGVRRREL